MSARKKPGESVGDAIIKDFGLEAAKRVGEHLLKFDVTRIGSIAMEGFRQKKMKDLTYFLMELARQAEDEGTDFQSEFQTRFFPEAGTSEVISQAIKAALEITDSLILSALARVVFFYEINDRPVDLQYRGLVRLFESIGSPEMEVLTKIVRCFQQLKSSQPDLLESGIIVESEKHPRIRVKVGLVTGRFTYAECSLSRELSAVLIASGIAIQPNYARSNARGDFTMTRETCDLMARLIGDPSA